MAECDYVREQYGVPACIGRRVLVSGKPAIIAADRGHYIGINYDADKPGVVRNAHPTSEVQYLGMGTVRPITRGQRRYLHWLEVADCFPDWKFGDWLKSEFAREAGHG
ncbi:hypothetical protein LMG26846_01966 [Achromobacter insuavis]|uniref:hypothetical protein n=1 Tax=Achromobacter insuavis TaxID=1287735 RepID=UPI0014655FDC|nr:hypothetical protein [Achromobacter insuavis]CAB3850463.1 hypothetical protein LMG26846_01966 [Achromobacter insuavis]